MVSEDISNYQLVTEFIQPDDGDDDDDDVIIKHRDQQWKEYDYLEPGGDGRHIYIQKEVGKESLRVVKRIMVDDFRRKMSEVESRKPGSRPSLQTLIKREVSHLIKVNHLQDCRDLFVEFQGWYQSRDFVFIVMEYVSEGDLGNFIKNFGPQDEKRSADITRQILEGLAVLHANKICHRDVKPKNILIASTDPFRVKMADFGISKTTDGTMLYTRGGTDPYGAPEQMSGSSSKQSPYSNAVDMWGLGCLVFELLTSEIADADGDSWYQFKRGNTKLPTEALERHKVSRSGIDFVNKLLVVDPGRRTSAGMALGHEWVMGNGM